MPKLTLSIENVTKRFGPITAVRELSLGVRQGEIVGILGPTGAGKSTLMRMVGGLVMPDSGDIIHSGTSMYRNYEACMRLTGFVPDRPEFYSYMTGMANLMTIADMYGGISASRVDEIVNQLKLDAYIEDKFNTYPAGVKQRMAIAAALLNSPRLLIIDEALDGLDPVSVVDLRRLLRRFADEYGMSMLITSHQMVELEKLCDRVGIMDNGVLIGVGAVETLKKANCSKLRHKILLDRPEAAAPFICEAAGVVTEIRGDAIIVDAEQAMIPKIISMLFARGHLVYELTPIEMTLEEAYYRMLRLKPVTRRESYDPYDGGELDD